jgi:hypothetical protein
MPEKNSWMAVEVLRRGGDLDLREPGLAACRRFRKLS